MGRKVYLEGASPEPRFWAPVTDNTPSQALHESERLLGFEEAEGAPD